VQAQRDAVSVAFHKHLRLLFVLKEGSHGLAVLVGPAPHELVVPRGGELLLAGAGVDVVPFTVDWVICSAAL
jgi:hypothetical protein